MEAHHAVFLVVFGFSLIVDTNEECGRSENIKCLHIIPGGLFYHNSGFHLPLWNRPRLEKACSHLDEFFSCYDNFIKNCNRTEIIGLYARTYNYLCGKGREPFLKYRVCLTYYRWIAVDEIIICTAGDDVLITKDEGKIMNISKCLKDAAGPCAEDDNKFFDGFIKEVISRSNHSGGQSHGMITAIVTALGLTILMICGILILFKRRERHVPLEKMQNGQST